MDFDQLKEAQGRMWGSGPFEEIEVNLADMHDGIVASIGAEPGEAWLDVGCGTGGVAGRAAAEAHWSWEEQVRRVVAALDRLGLAA